MPKIAEKYTCPTGGEVFAFTTDVNKWYIRHYIKDERRYVFKLIKGATTAIEALQLVNTVKLDISTPQIGTQYYIDRYINQEQQRCAIGQIVNNTLLRKQAFVKKLSRYCAEHDISKLSSIRRATFNEWATYFKIRSKLSLVQDHKHLRHWLNYLVSNEYIPTDPVILPKLRINEDDLASNPPISEKDWAIILRHINQWEKEAIGRPNYRHHWWRYVARHFYHLAKRSGLRPSEICNLKWSDVEVIENPHSIQQDAMATIRVRRSKTHSSRSVPTTQGRELRRLREWQEAELALRKKPPITSDSHIFIDINHKPYDVPAFSKAWRTFIIPPIKARLDGDKDYGKNYTLYSLRSSWINDQLRNGTDVFLLSKAAGHSVRTLQRYYEKLDVVSREAELATLPIGKTKSKALKRKSL